MSFRPPSLQIQGDSNWNNVASQSVYANKRMVIPHIPDANSPAVVPGAGFGAGIAYNDATKSIYYNTGVNPWLPIGAPLVGSPIDIYGAQLTNLTPVPSATEVTLGSVGPAPGFTFLSTLINPTFGSFNGSGVYTAAGDQKLTMNISLTWDDGLIGGSRVVRIYKNLTIIAEDISDPDLSSTIPTTQNLSIATTLALSDSVYATVSTSGAGVTINVLPGTSTVISGVRIAGL